MKMEKLKNLFLLKWKKRSVGKEYDETGKVIKKLYIEMIRK
nr:hypothetical protein [Fusobacterium pseudoperiodonticum]